MASLTPYEIASRVLSGQDIIYTPPAPAVDPNRLEPKICEVCGRGFLRPIGSGMRYCPAHDAA